MNLTQRDQRPRLLADGGAEPLQKGHPVAFDGGSGILFRESEVEGIPTIRARRTAKSGAESMNQPGNASEGFRMKNGQSRLCGRLNGHQNILTATDVMWTSSGEPMKLFSDEHHLQHGPILERLL